MKKQTRSEAALEFQLKSYDILATHRNYRLLTDRRWEADFAWINQDRSLAVFVDGQVHAIKDRRSADCVRDNVLPLALDEHWTLLRFTAEQVDSLVAVDSIRCWHMGSTEGLLCALQSKPSLVPSGRPRKRPSSNASAEPAARSPKGST